MYTLNNTRVIQAVHTRLINLQWNTITEMSQYTEIVWTGIKEMMIFCECIENYFLLFSKLMLTFFGRHLPGIASSIKIVHGRCSVNVNFVVGQWFKQFYFLKLQSLTKLFVTRWQKYVTSITFTIPLPHIQCWL